MPCGNCLEWPVYCLGLGKCTKLLVARGSSELCDPESKRSVDHLKARPVMSIGRGAVLVCIPLVTLNLLW